MKKPKNETSGRCKYTERAGRRRRRRSAHAPWTRRRDNDFLYFSSRRSLSLLRSPARPPYQLISHASRSRHDLCKKRFINTTSSYTQYIYSCVNQTEYIKPKRLCACTGCPASVCVSHRVVRGLYTESLIHTQSGALPAPSRDSTTCDSTLGAVALHQRTSRPHERASHTERLEALEAACVEG